MTCGMPDGPSSALDEEVRAEALDVLRDVLQWRLTEARLAVFGRRSMSWWTRWTAACHRRRSGPAATGLQGAELVVHVFARADGRDPDAAHRYVLDLWHRCCERFALDDTILIRPRNPPDDLGPTAAPGGIRAARGGGGAGVHQVVLRWLREVVVLSMVRAPGDGAGARRRRPTRLAGFVVIGNGR